MIKPLICFTAAGLVVHQNKILLVRHKKLGIWLAPGGHLEPQELPHMAALREVFEETGILAQITSAVKIPKGHTSEYQPVAQMVNLHWVSEENYQARVESPHQDIPHTTATWPRGCEQHLVWLYRMQVQGMSELRLNRDEATDIGWFDQTALTHLETTEDVKTELEFALMHEPV